MLLRYSLFGLGWSVLAALFAIGMTFHYENHIETTAHVPHWIVVIVMATLWVAFFIPVIVVLVQPLRERRRLQEA